ncbi:MAG: hypothetical protein PUD16_12655 [bacterium]|nr:hypothetical protein [bacterium]
MNIFHSFGCALHTQPQQEKVKDRNAAAQQRAPEHSGVKKARHQKNSNHQHGQNQRANGNSKGFFFDGWLYFNQKNRQPFSIYNCTFFRHFVKRDKVALCMSERTII